MREGAAVVPVISPDDCGCVESGYATAVKEIIHCLVPVVVPDLSDSLDGHLGDEDFSPMTTGGTTVDCFATLGEAAATLVGGASLYPAA